MVVIPVHYVKLSASSSAIDKCKAEIGRFKVVNYGHKLRVKASNVYGLGLKCRFNMLKGDKSQKYYKP